MITSHKKIFSFNGFSNLISVTGKNVCELRKNREFFSGWTENRVRNLLVNLKSRKTCNEVYSELQWCFLGDKKQLVRIRFAMEFGTFPYYASFHECLEFKGKLRGIYENFTPSINLVNPTFCFDAAISSEIFKVC